jgi:hypothetical protein
MFMRLFILALLVLPFNSLAEILQAEARSATEQQAKREALAALADSILVNVQSESSSFQEGSGKHKEELKITSRSDIPLIGVETNMGRKGNDFICKVSLDSSKSGPLYAKKISELHREISTLNQRISKTHGNDLYALLTQALTVTEQYEKYRAVSQLLGDVQISASPLTRADIESQLSALEKAAPSFEIAAQLLTKDLKVENIFIYPAMPHSSHEVTAFGRVLRDKLAAKLHTVESADKAQNYFKGDYEVLDNSIHVTYRLLDNSGNTLETRVTTLAPVAYQNVQVKPSTMDFDKLLHEGIAVSGDFRPQLTTNRGSEDVLFNEKDEVELLVKFNRPGYFYVVGLVSKKNENYSYLLELSNADTDRRFVRYINADDVNKWLSIGKFEASSPYGVESLQLIGSSDDPIYRLPAHHLDSKEDLYLTSNSAKQGIAMTRALRPKRSETDKQYQAEAVLMFTTMKKLAEKD